MRREVAVIQRRVYELHAASLRVYALLLRACSALGLS